MAIFKTLHNLNFLPSENSKRRMVFSVLVYEESILAFVVDKVIFLLNVLSIIIVIVANTNDNTQYQSIYDNANWMSITDIIIFSIFFIIYAIKLFCSSNQNFSSIDLEASEFPHSGKMVLKFILDPIQFLELLSLSIYSVIFYPTQTVRTNFMTCLYITYYGRLIKIAVYSQAGKIFFRILFRGKRLLLELILLILILILFLGGSIFLAEKNPVQNGQVKKSLEFKTMSDGIWWAVVTVTSTGYGDYFAVTLLGRLISSLGMIIGCLYLAMPLCIINNVFERYIIEDNCRQENFRADLQDKLHLGNVSSHDSIYKTVKASKMTKRQSLAAKKAEKEAKDKKKIEENVTEKKLNSKKDNTKSAEDLKNEMNRKTERKIGRIENFERNEKKDETENSDEMNDDSDFEYDHSYRLSYLKDKLAKIDGMIRQQNEMIDGLKDMRAFLMFRLEKSRMRKREDKFKKFKVGPKIESLFKDKKSRNKKF